MAAPRPGKENLLFVGDSFTFGCWSPAGQQWLDQVGEGLVAHPLEAGERQGGLVAEGEEDDRVASVGAAQLVVEQALVEVP